MLMEVKELDPSHTAGRACSKLRFKTLISAESFAENLANE